MAPDPPQPQATRRFRNTYWLLRHGRSTANERDLIVSQPEEGSKPEWGLTAEGRAQAAAAGQSLRTQLEQQPGGWQPNTLLLLASPFSRAVQTAVQAGAALGVGEADPRLQLEPALRERCFGAHELTSCSNYELVWADDAKSTASRPPGEGGESVENVAARTAGLVDRLEAQNEGLHIVLVSHGDALSILAAALLGAPLGAHRAHGLPNCGVLRIPTC